MTIILSVGRWLDSLGTEIAQSEWLGVGQKRMNTFAEAIRDFQPIHTDPEKDAQTDYDKTIAHGMLTMSVGMGELIFASIPKVESASMGIYYGFNKVRFLNPVRAGLSIRVRYALAGAEQPTPGQINAANNNRHQG